MLPVMLAVIAASLVVPVTAKYNIAVVPNAHVTRPCSRPSIFVALEALAASHAPARKPPKTVTSDHIPAHIPTPRVAPCGPAAAAPIASPNRLRMSMIPRATKVPRELRDLVRRRKGTLANGVSAIDLSFLIRPLDFRIFYLI